MYGLLIAVVAACTAGNFFCAPCYPQECLQCCQTITNDTHLLCEVDCRGGCDARVRNVFDDVQSVDARLFGSGVWFVSLAHGPPDACTRALALEAVPTRYNAADVAWSDLGNVAPDDFYATLLCKIHMGMVWLSRISMPGDPSHGFARRSEE